MGTEMAIDGDLDDHDDEHDDPAIAIHSSLVECLHALPLTHTLALGHGHQPPSPSFANTDSCVCPPHVFRVLNALSMTQALHRRRDAGPRTLRRRVPLIDILQKGYICGIIGGSHAQPLRSASGHNKLD